MPAANVRISQNSIEVLRNLAQAQSASMQEIPDLAIEAFRRQKFLESVNSAYASLRTDRAAWEEELRERAEWDQTLTDGPDQE